VKLSLCLTKQNIVKTYWGSGQLPALAALSPKLVWTRRWGEKFPAPDHPVRSPALYHL